MNWFGFDHQALRRTLGFDTQIARIRGHLPNHTMGSEIIERGGDFERAGRLARAGTKPGHSVPGSHGARHQGSCSGRQPKIDGDRLHHQVAEGIEGKGHAADCIALANRTPRRMYQET